MGLCDPAEVAHIEAEFARDRQLMAGHEAASSLAAQELQGTIYRVALSLDALLLNGIHLGILQQAAEGFVAKLANKLCDDLGDLEEGIQTAGSDPMARAIFAALRAKCEELIHVVTEMASFRKWSLDQVHNDAASILSLRADCVELIQRLENHLGTPKAFYQSRPRQSTEDVDRFLAGLEQTFQEEWRVANR
ncbi:MAG: hypothetical protein U0793_02515 [Gemmataceae bacterium]